MTRRLSLKRILLSIPLFLLILIAIPVSFLAWNYFSDPDPVNSHRAGYTNDASQLEKTEVTVVHAASDSGTAIKQIAGLILRAKKEGKKISIAGAQHSMGGHTIYPGGIVLDMKGFNYMQLDTVTNILHVGSGAMWSGIIPYLEKYHRSVAVMQSNNSFSVGGSVSVNCHGWQPESPPIASTVQSFRLMNADGQLLTCSRTENEELFSLALGGYGLFGVIVDVQLKVVPDKTYRIEQHVISSKDYVKEFNRHVRTNRKAGMVYGRINVNPDEFMEEAILSVFVDDSSVTPQSLDKTPYPSLRRTVFRSSVNSDFGKNLRWTSEKLMTRIVDGKTVSRNQLLNESVEIFQNTDTTYTDILHEYFIPEARVPEFIDSVKKIMKNSGADLLNITVRNVRKDDVTYLHYAKEDVFAFVFLFNQERSADAEKEMATLTRKLINASLSLNGSYYLPYRLHADKGQFEKAYPQAEEFFRLKKKYDPEEIFQNKFYTTYR